MKSDINQFGKDIAAFIIPFFTEGNNMDYIWLEEALKSIKNQTDENWMIIIVDDNSSDPMCREKLSSLRSIYGSKLKLIFLEQNQGPGNARNEGIRFAYQNRCPFVLFLDSDDFAPPNRLEITRRIFSKNKNAGVVYSTFEVIDEYGIKTEKDQILPSILEIIQQHSDNPPQGKSVWRRIAIETGYVNLTSATSVRTELAYMYPFTNERVSEDFYTWLIYSASGWEFEYTGEVIVKYRIPRNTGSRTRDKLGGKHIFNMLKSIVDVRGFQYALDLAYENGEIENRDKKELMIEFCKKRAESMKLDNENEIALDYYRRAYDLDAVFTKKIGFEI